MACGDKTDLRVASSQYLSAEKLGIKVVSVNEDTLRDAGACGRNLWKELGAGVHELVIMLPDQLMTPEFATTLKATEFLSALTFVDVDEAHLWDTWGRSFREKPYKALSNLRHRIPSRVTWTGLTATLIPGASENRVMEGLGFVHQRKHGRRSGAMQQADRVDGSRTGVLVHRMPVDRPNLKITTRFLTHSLTGTDFPDLYWMISLLVRKSPLFQTIIISCGTIDLATRLCQSLISYLPLDFPDRDYIIKPFHSLLSAEGRAKIISDFGPNGRTKIILGTDCMAHGLDVDTEVVVLLPKVDESLEEMVQWMGRAGRRAPGHAIVYAHDWMRKETEEDRLPKSLGGRGMSKRMLEEREAKRAKVPAHIVCFFNPPTGMCTRAALSQAFGEGFARPANSPCCEYHNPDCIHENENERFAKMLKKLEEKRNPSLRSNGTFLPLTGTPFRDEAQRILTNWRLQQWKAWPDRNPFLPPCTFMLDHLLEALCDKLHLITSYDRFASVLQEWNLLPQYGRALYEVALALITDIDKRHRLLEESAAANGSTTNHPDVNTAADKTGDGARLPLGSRQPLGEFAHNAGLGKRSPPSPQKRRVSKRVRLANKEDIPPSTSGSIDIHRS